MTGFAIVGFMDSSGVVYTFLELCAVPYYWKEYWEYHLTPAILGELFLSAFDDIGIRDSDIEHLSDETQAVIYDRLVTAENLVMKSVKKYGSQATSGRYDDAAAAMFLCVVKYPDKDIENKPWETSSNMFYLESMVPGLPWAMVEEFVSICGGVSAKDAFYTCINVPLTDAVLDVSKEQTEERGELWNPQVDFFEDMVVGLIADVAEGANYRVKRHDQSEFANPYAVLVSMAHPENEADIFALSPADRIRAFTFKMAHPEMPWDVLARLLAEDIDLNLFRALL
jgi:hypothetical protein